MTKPISGPAIASSEASAPQPKAADSKHARELEKAAHDFEAIFVRSMLEQSGALGKKKDGYGDMAVSALATTTSDGKGLGLGDAIKNAIEQSEGLRNPKGVRT